MVYEKKELDIPPQVHEALKILLEWFSQNKVITFHYVNPDIWSVEWCDGRY